MNKKMKAAFLLIDKEDGDRIFRILKSDDTIHVEILMDMDRLKETMLRDRPDCMIINCTYCEPSAIQRLKVIKNYGIPIILVTRDFRWKQQLQSFMGVDLLIKPVEKNYSDVFENQLLIRVKSSYRPYKKKETKTVASSYILAIGASTGGPKAVTKVLKNMPKQPCGVIIVQHISYDMTEMFSQRLNDVCQMDVGVAQENELIYDGKIYVARQKQHLYVVPKPDGYHLHYKTGKMVQGVCPSINVLFESLADTVKSHTMAVLLTGMGKDGAEGLKKIKDSGGYTIVQDEKTSDIYGMPREAVKLHAECIQLPVEQIAAHIIKKISERI